MFKRTLKKAVMGSLGRRSEKSYAHGDIGEWDVSRRLHQLKREWDTDRFIEVEAGSLVLLGSLLAFSRGKKFALLPGLVSGMLLLHAFSRWYPWKPVLRRFGVRSQRDIAIEEYALKAVRGDFEEIDAGRDQVNSAMLAARV